MSSSDDSGSTGTSLLYLCLFALSAITVFRRELSPNHNFVVPPQQTQDKNRKEEEEQQQQLNWNEIEFLLEGTGLEFGASLLTVWMRLLHMKQQRQQHQRQQHQAKRAATAAPAGCCNADDVAVIVEEEGDLWKVLPVDVQVQVLTFLHPRDVRSFAGVSRSCLESTLGSSSSALWKRLWFRDFAWIVTCWEPGKQALERSNRISSLNSFDNYTARFYFSFAYCYLPYVLASHNTPASCLVGLGGHVYDLSCFLPAHPGSQETVLVNAGRCATEFFAGIRHSYTAQKLAQKLCVIVDCSRLLPCTTTTTTTVTSTNAATTGGGLHHSQNEYQNQNHHYAYGLRPTKSTKLVESPYLCPESLTEMFPPSSTDFFAVRPRAPGPQTAATARFATSSTTTPTSSYVLPSSFCSLFELRAQLRREEVAAKEAATRRYSDLTPLRECHVFFDPFDGRWRAWYTDFDFVSVFVGDDDDDLLFY